MNRDYEKIKSQIEELTAQLGSMGEEEYGQAREKAMEYGQMLKEKGKVAAQKTKEVAKKVDNYAHEHPWMWMGLGIVVGLTVGAIASKKIRCRCDEY